MLYISLSYLPFLLHNLSIGWSIDIVLGTITNNISHVFYISLKPFKYADLFSGAESNIINVCLNLVLSDISWYIIFSMLFIILQVEFYNLFGIISSFLRYLYVIPVVIVCNIYICLIKLFVT